MKRILFAVALFSLSAATYSQIVWSTEMEVAPSSYGNGNPNVVLDGSGNPVVSWGGSSDCYVATWNDGSFNTPVEVSPAAMSILTGANFGPEIASHGDTIYAIFKETPVASGGVMVAKSVDGGTTWLDPVQADAIGSDLSEFCHIGVDDIGNPVVVFNRFDPGWGNPRFVYTYSTDFGATFAPDTILSGWSGGGGLGSGPVCECCPASIAVSGSNVAVAYRDNDANIRDTWVAVSYDGVEFTDGMDVDGNGWFITSCPTTGPDLEIVGDKIYTTYANAASGTGEVFWSESTLSTATGGSAVSITGTVAGVNNQNFPKISTYGNHGVITWKQVNAGEQEIGVTLTTDLASGFSTSYDVVAAENATISDVVLGNEIIHVVWRDYISGSVKYKYGVYGNLAGIQNKEEISLDVFPNPASEIVNISFNEAAENDYHVLLVDQKGAVVASTDVSGHDLKAGYRLDIQDLKTGTYILQLSDEEGVVARKNISIN